MRAILFITLALALAAAQYGGPAEGGGGGGDGGGGLGGGLGNILGGLGTIAQLIPQKAPSTIRAKAATRAAPGATCALNPGARDTPACEELAEKFCGTGGTSAFIAARATFVRFCTNPEATPDVDTCLRDRCDSITEPAPGHTLDQTITACRICGNHPPFAGWNPNGMHDLCAEQVCAPAAAPAPVVAAPAPATCQIARPFNPNCAAFAQDACSGGVTTTFQICRTVVGQLCQNAQAFPDAATCVANQCASLIGPDNSHPTATVRAVCAGTFDTATVPQSERKYFPKGIPARIAGVSDMCAQLACPQPPPPPAPVTTTAVLAVPFDTFPPADGLLTAFLNQAKAPSAPAKQPSPSPVKAPTPVPTPVVPTPVVAAPQPQIVAHRDDNWRLVPVDLDVTGCDADLASLKTQVQVLAGNVLNLVNKARACGALPPASFAPAPALKGPSPSPAKGPTPVKAPTPVKGPSPVKAPTPVVPKVPAPFVYGGGAAPATPVAQVAVAAAPVAVPAPVAAPAAAAPAATPDTPAAPAAPAAAAPAAPAAAAPAAPAAAAPAAAPAATPDTPAAPAPAPAAAPAVAVNCVGAFGPLSACSATACGTTGTQTQTFAISTPAANGGTACANAAGDVNTVNCAAAACPTVPGYKISAAGFLTDDKGRTLYQNSQDTDSTVTCNAASGCAPFWPNPPVLDGGAVPGPVGTTTADGKTYPTYKGRPVYYFGGDRNPGQTGGDGDGTFSTCKP